MRLPAGVDRVQRRRRNRTIRPASCRGAERGDAVVFRRCVRSHSADRRHLSVAAAQGQVPRALPVAARVSDAALAPGDRWRPGNGNPARRVLRRLLLAGDDGVVRCRRDEYRLDCRAGGVGPAGKARAGRCSRRAHRRGGGRGLGVVSAYLVRLKADTTALPGRTLLVRLKADTTSLPGRTLRHYRGGHYGITGADTT